MSHIKDLIEDILIENIEMEFGCAVGHRNAAEKVWELLKEKMYLSDEDGELVKPISISAILNSGDQKKIDDMREWFKVTRLNIELLAEKEDADFLNTIHNM